MKKYSAPSREQSSLLMIDSQESVARDNKRNLDEGDQIKSGWGLMEYRKAGYDSRLVSNGDVIPAEYYADQPYIVRTNDGAWLCVLTTGSGHEGFKGQHIRALRSEDFGKTWSAPVAIETPDGPEASWAVSLVAPSGRIFVFYIYNADDIRELPADNPPCRDGKTNRMDSHGHYVFRWSDDHGRTWSDKRVHIPVREFEIDRQNSTAGKVRLFWNVGRPLISKGSVFLTLHKVGGFGAGWFTQSEGAFLRSDDLLRLDDPGKATWQTLPEGDVGLRTPSGGGPIAEEQSLIELSDGSFFVVYRSVDGHPVGCYSRDRGRTWESPKYLQYANGHHLKHPRAACFAWRLTHGDYVLWFHNHGGNVLARHPERSDRGYDDRNPAWMCRGREIATPQGIELVWDNPEIVLYDDDPCVRMSYPDLREEGADIFLTETQKAIARVHLVGLRLSHALRFGPGGFDGKELRQEAVFDWLVDSAAPVLPKLSSFVARCPESPYGTTDQRMGFSLEVEFDASIKDELGIIVEAWNPSFGGLRLEVLADGALKLTLSDGRTEFSWSSDVGRPVDRCRNHFVVVVDGGPKVISFFLNGEFCDGASQRQFGWGRFPSCFHGLPEGLPLCVESPDGLKALRIYPRYLLAAEVTALFLSAAGPEASTGEPWNFKVAPDFSETSANSSELGATP